MKIWISLMVFISVSTIHSQIVNIPDANFKNALVNEPSADTDGDGTYEIADTNGDGEIQVSEAEVVVALALTNEDIASLEGLQSFINLEQLFAAGNDLTELTISNNVLLKEIWVQSNMIASLDCSNQPDLEVLVANSNNISSLDISQNTSLWMLRITQNQLTSIDVSHMGALEVFWCSRNLLTEIDVSANGVLRNFSCIETPTLTAMNIQNGNNSNMTRMWSFGNTNLSCILVDDATADYPECDSGSNQGWCFDSETQFVEDLADCSLGIDDNPANLSDIDLMPVPTQSLLYIETNLWDELKEIEIFDLQGRKVQSTKMVTQLDISSFRNGVYLVQFKIGDRLITKKIIKD